MQALKGRCKPLGHERAASTAVAAYVALHRPGCLASLPPANPDPDPLSARVQADFLKRFMPSFKDHTTLSAGHEHKYLYTYIGTVAVLRCVGARLCACMQSHWDGQQAPLEL